jgi:hypothetical protein
MGGWWNRWLVSAGMTAVGAPPPPPDVLTTESGTTIQTESGVDITEE